MAQPLDVTYEQFADTTVIILAGDLDSISCEQFMDTMQKTPHDATAVILDASALTFCDSMGLRSLILAQDLVTRRGQHLSLVGVGGALHRLLTITGTMDLFSVHHSVLSALEGQQAQQMRA
ncbi:STAS domain-containing protein [[Actinomadura] parvosata]|uniref:STAS domain-containing protein n=1 Tax=[Actinomadura] parvosata TaxID=1955412 RepID=UPI00406CA908